MEVTQKEQDFTKPQVGPTKGVVTAEEARRKQGLPEPGQFEKTPFISGVTDYRKSRLGSLFNDSNFRNAMLNYNYAESNINNFDYLRISDPLGRRATKNSVLREVDLGNVPDRFLSTQENPITLTRNDLQRNVIRPIKLDPNVNMNPKSREEEDQLINAKLDFMLKNPIQNKAVGNIFSFALQDGKGNKYVVPTFETSKILIEQSRQTTPTSFKPKDPSVDTSKAQSQARFFQLLKNMPKNLDNVKIAELVYAQETGSLEEYRRKHGISDFVKFFPNLAVGTLELATKGVAAMNNHFYDLVGAEESKIDTSKIDFKGLKYGAETFSEMTNGLVTLDGAAAILAYSPDLKTSIGREIGIGSIMYGITLGGGLTIGAIKNRNFRNFVKETYKSNTFAGGLKKANKQGYTDFDIFDQYWNANNIGFLKNFRKDFSTFTMRMDMEGKALLGDKRYKDKLLFLKNKLRGQQRKKEQLEELYKSNPTPANQLLLQNQNKITERIEKNLSNEFAKSNIPSTFTGLFRDEVGAAIGLGTANFMYQRNSVDPKDMLPPWYLMLVSGVGGVVATDLGVRGTGSLLTYLNDMRKNKFGYDTNTAGQKGRARQALQWLGRADIATQNQVLESIDSHRILGDRINNLVDGNGNKIIKNPDALEKTIYDLSSINVMQALSDQMIDTLKYKNIVNFDDTFQEFLTLQRQKVIVYDQLAFAISDLRKAKIHPDIQSDKLAANTLQNYEDMFVAFGKQIDASNKLVDGFVTKLESDLKDMSEGWMINPKGTDMSVFRNYEKKLNVLREYYTSENLLKGFDPIDAFNAANAKLLRFDEALAVHTKSIGSITQNAPLANSLMVQNFDSIKSKFKGRGDALFNQLRRDYGANGSTPAYADVADFYGVIKRYATEDGGKLSDFFDPDEFFFAQTTAGTKKALGIRPDPSLTGFSGLFDEAAARYLDPDNVKNYPVELQRAINVAKEEYPDASPFQIWQQLHDKLGPESVDLPVSMDEWRAIASKMSDKAFQRRGTVQGKDEKSLYDYWVSIAEDESTGFSFNFFDPSQRTFIGDKAISEWRTAKGAWHDFKTRYGSGFGKDWGNIAGTTPQGDKILRKKPSEWVETIFKELTSSTFDQAKADELVSKLAQAFGGYNITRDVTVRNDAQFTFNPNISKQDDVLGTNNEGMAAVQAIIKRVNNLILLNSPQGAELRTSLVNGKKVTINDLKELKSGDNYQTFLNNVDLLRVGQDAQGQGGAKLIDRTEIDESNDIIQLFTYSENVKKTAKQLQTDLTNQIKVVKDELKTASGQVIQKLTQQRIQLTQQLTPKGIHDLIKLGEQGLKQLDETRRAYELLVIDQIGVGNENYIQIMRHYDKFIAGRALEHVDNMVRKPNPQSTPKATLNDPLEGGSIDITQEEIVDANLMFELLGQNKDWQGTFKEIVNRGLVNKTDNVYDDYLTIAAFMRGDIPLSTKIGVTGIPRGLGAMSLVSRVYALNRGVIGLPYFSTELAFQGFRKKRLKMFQEMMSKPEIGKIVVDMLRTGEMPSAKDNTRLTKAIINSLARHKVQAETDPDLEEMNKIESGYEKRRANIERQMERLTKKDFVRRGTKAIGNIADKTKAFITGDENEAVQ